MGCDPLLIIGLQGIEQMILVRTLAGGAIAIPLPVNGKKCAFAVRRRRLSGTIRTR
jgi:hypothetical protein